MMATAVLVAADMPAKARRPAPPIWYESGQNLHFSNISPPPRRVMARVAMADARTWTHNVATLHVSSSWPQNL
jgi:hypothetical protein